MTMTQRYAGMLRRHASEWDKQDMRTRAEATRQAACHMEDLQAQIDAATCPWKPMKAAPKDGTTVLVLLEGSDIPKAVRWLTEGEANATNGAGWYMSWDDYALTEFDTPRYWMECPDDPDDPEATP